MKILLYILLCAALLPYLKWLLFAVIYPFMAIDSYRRKRNKDSRLLIFIASPYLLVECFFRRGFKRFFLFNVSCLPSNHLRKVIYKGLGANVGRHVVFHYGTEIRDPHFLSVADGTIIGDNAILDAQMGLIIGRNVNMSSNVSIYTLQHDYRDPYFSLDRNRKKMSVEIDDRVWLGPNVIVLPGVHIGEGAVCCAGAVVTSDVSPYDVVAGIPARHVSSRPQGLQYEFDGKSCRLY